MENGGVAGVRVVLEQQLFVRREGLGSGLAENGADFALGEEERGEIRSSAS